MKEFDRIILIASENICKNISQIATEEGGFQTQNILNAFRDLVEAVDMRIYCEDFQIDEYDCNLISRAVDYVASRGDLRFLSEFYRYLQFSSFQRALDEDASVRLTLRYYEWLIRIRQYVKRVFGLEILYNLDDYPLQQDDSLDEYYEKIAAILQETKSYNDVLNNRYYVQKKKVFFVGGEVYYEITVTPADNYSSKFNRFTVFSKQDIPSYYAIKLHFRDTYISILNRSMPIRIVDAYQVAIRPIEFRDLASILNLHTVGTDTNEYRSMMNYLTETGLSFTNVIDFDDAAYQKLKLQIQSGSQSNNLFAILDTCRRLSIEQKRGYIVLRYLLLKMRHSILKEQFSGKPNNLLSDLQLDNRCLPFEEMPFDASLRNHNPMLFDVLRSIDAKGREHEILSRNVRTNTQQKVKLYTPLEDVKKFGDVTKLVDTFNSKLYSGHVANRSLVIDNDDVYINGFESNSVEIVSNLINRKGNGISGYAKSASKWLKNNKRIDCEEKRKIISGLFVNSNLALIYGAAGTGKTTLIRHIAEYFSDKQKLFLANTNPAIENLRRQIKVDNCEFSTIASSKSLIDNYEFDVVFIDECSTVDNRSMVEILRNLSCEALVLVGDVYQIQAINFGNWFGLARHFLPTKIVYELTTPYRSKDNSQLKTLWDRVRCIDPRTYDDVTQYSSPLDETIFTREQQDEIILCLNYDGLYGINNLNRFMQEGNPNKAVTWDSWTYKVGDPVIFIENNRFAPLLYNNLKGWIRGIKKTSSSITFDVEIDLLIDDDDAECFGVELLNCEVEGHSLIRFSVEHYVDDDVNEREVKQVVPFQVSYAISIHKAQGLEYDSVKVVVTSAIEDLITHNIFYTAITRARKNLKIYWSPATQNKVLSNLTPLSYRRDAEIISAKFNLKLSNGAK